MPNIVLKVPFIRHYAGNLLTLRDSTGISGWYDDERLRDRQNLFDKRIYFLPDNGKGQNAELFISDTFLCPDHLLNDIDIKSGPCRITSVSEGLSVKQHDPYYASPFPMGKGRVLLHDTEKYSKNLIKANLDSESIFNKVVILNRLYEEKTDILSDFQNRFAFDFSDYNPGFYNVDIFCHSLLLHSFTVIKSYPIVVFYDEKTHEYNVEKTLW